MTRQLVFDAEPTVRLPSLPSLLDLPGVAAVDQPVEQRMRTAYFDTADLRLTRHGSTLCRCQGADDEGWRLTVARAGDEALEVHRPLGRATGIPPKALADLARAHVRDQRLAAVAQLDTRRAVHRLLDRDGAQLAVVVADQVERRGPDEFGPASWREVRLELCAGRRKLRDAVGELLQSCGHRPASGRSVHRGLDGARPPHQPVPVKLRKRSTAGDVALAYLQEQRAALIGWDPYARSDAPDAVHKMRVSCRRLRGVLATYRPLLDVALTEPLRADLKWLGALLGPARDAEVIHARLAALVSEQPPELLLGPVRRRIDLELGARHRTALVAIRRELNGERYFRLLDRLDAACGSGVRAEGRALRPASAVVPHLVGKAGRRVLRAAAAAEQTRSVEESDRRLHEVRKAAKRARYTAESVQPVFGRPAAALVVAMTDLQELLGTGQDAAATRDVLRQLGVQAHLSGENGFSFGRLHGLEERRGMEPTEYRRRLEAVKGALSSW